MKKTSGSLWGAHSNCWKGKEYRGPLLQRMTGLSVRADDYGADNVGSIKLIV